MQSKNLVWISIILLVLFSVFSLAETEITVTPIDNEITTAEQASFKLTITNNADENQVYNIYSLQSGQGWNVDVSPLKDKSIELSPGKSHTTTVVATPLEKGKLSPGIYTLYTTIQSDLGEIYSKALKIYLSPAEPITYLPTIKVEVDMDEKINPTEPVSVKIFLENKNALDLTGLAVKIQSEIPEFAKEVTVDLLPLEKKTVELTIMPSKFQQPKEYVLFFVFEHKSETIKIVEKKIEIVSLLPKFEVTSSKDEAFLKTIDTLTIINTGNVRNSQLVKYPTSFLASLFSTNTGESISEDEERYFAWEMTLSPNESAILTIVTNYRLLLYLLIAILICGGFYLYVQSPVSIKKTAVTAKGSENGTLSEIKITLEMSNRSNRNLKDVEVIDLVPEIANVEKSLELGTIKPIEIKHTKAGTKVIWSLAELEAHEHRIITYKLKAKLNILGVFSLPRATVEFKKKGSRRKSKAYSNTFRISS